MRTVGFTVQEDIYVVVEGSHFDLHNDFDFIGHVFSEESKSLSLHWVLGTGDWVRKGQPSKLSLYFEGVSFFEKTPRTTDLYPEDDSCLEGFYFISDEEWCSGPFTGPESGSLMELPENRKHCLSFASGVDIILVAEVCSIRLGETT